MEIIVDMRDFTANENRFVVKELEILSRCAFNIAHIYLNPRFI